jgi:transmembrane sensor
MVENARKIISLLDLEDKGLSEEEVNQDWKKVQAGIKEAKAPVYKLKPPYRFFRSAYRIAAIFIGLIALSAGFWFYYLRSSEHKVITGYGETLNYVLPDNSEVALNGNSSITYQDNWKRKGIREVWLKGEAFFRIKSSTEVKRFIVHTPAMDIEVTGTEFNVQARPEKVSVALVSGKVNVSLVAPYSDNVSMLPGELLVFDQQEKKLVKNVTSLQPYTAWLHKKLIFDNTPLRDVILTLGETFGIEIQLVDSAKLSEKVTGSFSSDDVDDLLKALSKSFDIRFEKKK